MIPKIIHYCWFGKKKKSKLIEKCIKSWHKYCPDYRIIEWNEDNFDVNCCTYVREAYEAKKWAFVSDYARFFVLEQCGGIYLDTDVELLKPLDCLLEKNFMGFENANSVNTGLIMGCNQGTELCVLLLERYKQDHFIINGKFNLYTVCERVTDILVEYGLALENRTQNIFGYIIYDTSYFNPYDMVTGKTNIDENTFSIHHYAGSWFSKKEKMRGKVYKIISKICGKKIAEKIRGIFGEKDEQI